MSDLKQVFSVSTSSAKTKNMGNSTPDWVGNYSDKSKWASGNYDYFYWQPDNRAYIQYGQNAQEWASVRFFGQKLVLDSEELQSDNSYKVKGKIEVLFVNGRNTDYTGVGVDVKRTIKLAGNVVDTFTGTTADEYTQQFDKSYDISETIKPQDSTDKTQLVIETVYPNGEYENSTIKVGIKLRNNKLPIYIPGAIRKSGKWEELDKTESGASSHGNGSGSSNSDDKDKSDSDSSSSGKDNSSNSKERDASPIMKSKILDWAKNNVGRAVDFDKRFGAQCVDAITQMNSDLNLGLNLSGEDAYHIYFNNRENLPSGWKDMQTNHDTFAMKDQKDVWEQIPTGSIVWFKFANGGAGHVGYKASSKFCDVISQNFRGDGSGQNTTITRDDLSDFVEQGNRLLGAWYKAG